MASILKYLLLVRCGIETLRRNIVLRYDVSHINILVRSASIIKDLQYQYRFNKGYYISVEIIMQNYYMVRIVGRCFPSRVLDNFIIWATSYKFGQSNITNLALSNKGFLCKHPNLRPWTNKLKCLPKRWPLLPCVVDSWKIPATFRGNLLFLETPLIHVY